MLLVTAKAPVTDTVLPARLRVPVPGELMLEPPVAMILKSKSEAELPALWKSMYGVLVADGFPNSIPELVAVPNNAVEAVAINTLPVTFPNTESILFAASNDNPVVSTLAV